MPAGASSSRFAAFAFTLLCAIAGISHAFAGEGSSADQTFEPRPSDQIWLVNTRGIGCVDGRSGWSTSRYDAGYWKGADDQAFYSSDDQETVTVIYIHGNRMDAAGAEARGLAIYRELFSSQTDGKIRYVIWSWPSDQIRGPIKDVRFKAFHSDDEAFMLARFLAPIPADRRVGLIGFSYGARIIGGGLHILGGGELVGRGIEEGKRPTFRVVYWAAGVQNDWLLPGNVHGKAMPLGLTWLNIYNSCDSILWRFDKIDKCDGSPGLGYVGLAGGKSYLPTDLADRYEEFDASHLIGGDHRSEPYFFNGEIIRKTREAVLGHKPEAQAKETAASR
ncbi:MAG: hypothetical protein K8R36_07945 [Planctomycetales bacterium]|nr:hypothetical protein [Planctomycetales bacterium]